MARVTLLFKDIANENGRFAVDLNVEDSRIDDGFVTAAHVTGLFVMQAVSTTAFGEGCAAFAQVRGLSLDKTVNVNTTLVFEDMDLDTGQFQTSITVEGQNGEAESPLLEGMTTAANLAATFTLAALGSDDFRSACTAFAHDLLGGRDGSVNDPVVPANDAANTKAA